MWIPIFQMAKLRLTQKHQVVLSTWPVVFLQSLDHQNSTTSIPTSSCGHGPSPPPMLKNKETKTKNINNPSMQIDLGKYENPRHTLMTYENWQTFQADSSPSHFSLCCSFTEPPLSFTSYPIFTVIRPSEKPLIPSPVLSLAACGLWASPAVNTCSVCPPPDEMGVGRAL